MTTTTLPSTALDAQLDLLHWYGTEVGIKYANNLGDLLTAETKRKGVDVDDDGLNHEGAGAILHRVLLTRAETYAVSTEIIDVLEVAAQTMPPYALHETDPPSKSGFIYLERPIIVKDIHGKSLAVRAIGWDPIMFSDKVDRLGWSASYDDYEANHPDDEWALILILWTDPADPRDHMHEQYLSEREQWITRPPGNLWSIVGGVWPVGMFPQRDNIIYQFTMSFFRFCQEEWVDSRAVSPGRPAVRRAERRGVPQPRVRVVRLRRRGDHHAHDHGSDRKLYVNHRGLVRGHWRNQWYPSIQAHRPKWIAEYLKGPDDAPLVVDDKVFHVIR